MKRQRSWYHDNEPNYTELDRRSRQDYIPSNDSLPTARGPQRQLPPLNLYKTARISP